MTWWIQSIVEGTGLQRPWIVLALATFVVDLLEDRCGSCIATSAPPRSTRTSRIEDDLEDDYSSDIDEVLELVFAVVDEPEPVVEVRRDRFRSPPSRTRCPSLPVRGRGAHLAVRRTAQGRTAVGESPSVQKVPDDLSELDWTDLVPNVYSIDSTGVEQQGQQAMAVGPPRRLGRGRSLARRGLGRRRARFTGRLKTRSGTTPVPVVPKSRPFRVYASSECCRLTPRRPRPARRRSSTCRGCCSATPPDPRRHRSRSRPSAGTPAPSRRTRGSASCPTRRGSACR